MNLAFLFVATSLGMAVPSSNLMCKEIWHLDPDSIRECLSDSTVTLDLRLDYIREGLSLADQLPAETVAVLLEVNDAITQNLDEQDDLPDIVANQFEREDEDVLEPASLEYQRIREAQQQVAPYQSSGMAARGIPLSDFDDESYPDQQQLVHFQSMPQPIVGGIPLSLFEEEYDEGQEGQQIVPTSGEKLYAGLFAFLLAFIYALLFLN